MIDYLKFNRFITIWDFDERKGKNKIGKDKKKESL